ncbi:MAG: dTDP-4-dehydrorhamnose 3,5-epimerase [Gammaproteobacteria bacterium RIFCSPHIGHO2_12_FULL_37_14]|nr:MAG: dTDP-4-dehydrorhamnose 3,5-epimerase [Gammaproteobacteria bacterium RIFCSPHIGHO2_12_FULL_37_14]
MDILNTSLSGLIIIQPKLFNDDRGYFLESYHQHRYSELNIPHFVQDNLSHSNQHVLRGLHYQLPNPQGKLIWVTHGEILDIALDIRVNSPTFGQWYSIVLSEENHTQIYVPPGFAHGFCVLTPLADVHYKCTDVYIPTNEHGIIWNDPHLKIPWPLKKPLLSPKDQMLPMLHEVSLEQLFT